MRNVTLTRREFLQASLLASGCLLIDFDKLNGLDPRSSLVQDPFQGGQYLGFIDFSGEGRAPLSTLWGSELDGRLVTDLSALEPENPITPTSQFYVRTRASELFPDEPWHIRLGGLVESESKLRVDDLRKMSKAQGVHLMECSGNTRTMRFGLLSVADWKGVSVAEALALPKRKSRATRVMISGFDRYKATSANSVPGADWVFTPDELSKAFLATEMNGQPLTRDHGAPVRLVVPGWYGCACIKWVNAITLVDDQVEATSQMQEFAVRTHQQGVPRFASDYRPAIIDQTAMPIRIEKWLLNQKIKYRVVGILWGGSHPIKRLEIRFNPEEEYVSVDKFSHTTNDPWSLWSHAWTPKTPGSYLIRLRVADPVVETKRLDSGHYVRSVEVTEV